MTYRLLGVRTVGRGAVVDYQRLHFLTEEGTSLVRDVIRHRGGVAILPVWGEEVTLIRQYRAALGRRIWEIPAGKIESDDWDLADTARRELLEETGLRAERMTNLGMILPSPGYTDERITLFAAEGLSQGNPSPDGVEEESIEVLRVGLRTALEMIESAEITDGTTVVALLRWSLRAGSGG